METIKKRRSLPPFITPVILIDLKEGYLTTFFKLEL